MKKMKREGLDFNSFLREEGKILARGLERAPPILKGMLELICVWLPLFVLFYLFNPHYLILAAGLVRLLYWLWKDAKK